MKLSGHLAWLVLASLTAVTVTASGRHCKCFPGDDCWPTEEDWDQFNSTVGGGLVRTVPLGSICHDPDYDQERCQQLRANWQTVSIHLDSSSSVQAPIFANASCDPFTPRDSPCLMGNYVAYAVNVTGPEDISETIRFGERRNIRLVIRNTGHDYMGRSTGAGGLAIWTHHLDSVEVKSWNTKEHKGYALKIGAGASGREVLRGAAAANLVATTGECPSVGVAGGYVQSGGHSPLATAFGLGADQTLEMEVVTANGRLITSNPRKNADLFWALSGSGSGAFGVIVSLTIKTWPDAVTSGAAFTIQEPGRDHAEFLNAWHDVLPSIIDNGIMATYAADKGILSARAITGFNRTREELEAALTPFVAKMAEYGVAVSPDYTQFRSYHDHYSHYFGTIANGQFEAAGANLIGGRLIPRGKATVIGSAINETFQIGAGFVGQALNVSRFASDSRAVLPQWRDALIMSAAYLPYDVKAPYEEMRDRQNVITRHIMSKIEGVTPGAGAYTNEADFQQPDWQETFYGANYKRLLGVKKEYDHKELFYAPISVGSERWEVQRDGRLCAAAKV